MSLAENKLGCFGKQHIHLKNKLFAYTNGQYLLTIYRPNLTQPHKKMFLKTRHSRFCHAVVICAVEHSAQLLTKFFKKF
jgi:hypothetical protein